MAKIGDVCASKIDTLNAAYNGKIDYIDISAVDNDKKKITNTETLQIKEAPSRARQLVECDDIIVSLVRPNLNAVAVVENSSENLQVASTGYCVLRCNQAVYSRYLFYFCQSETFINRMTVQATGASYPAVSNSIVKNCEIPLPERNKQKEIADILDKVTGLISLRKQQLAKLDELVKARFVEMFGDINVNNKKWMTYPLGELCTIVRGGSPRPIERYLGGTIPWIKIGDATTGENIYLNSTKEYIIQEGVKKSRMIKAGSLIFANCGVSLGFARIITFDGCIHDGWLAMEDIDEKLDKIFLLYSLNQMTEYFRKTAPAGTQPNLNTNIMKMHRQIVPPMEMQKAFISFVKCADRQKQTVQQSLEKLELMKKALMQEYFG